jgi:hypothetical protein
MRIRRIISNLYAFLLDFRQSGTTTLLKKVALENDVWVLVPDEKLKKEFGEKGVTFDDLTRLKGKTKKPILFDNYTLLQLTEFTLDEFKDLERAIEYRNTLIKKIKDDIALFERVNNIRL